jgi:hypothetical protein
MVSMFGQTAAGWKELRNINVEKKVVLKADSDTICSLGQCERLKLRIFCEQGSSFILHLENRDSDNPTRDDGQAGIVSIRVPKEKLLDCLEKNLEVIFWDNDTRQGVAFLAKAVTSDKWFGDRQLLCEPLQ